MSDERSSVIKDLIESLSISNSPWNSWELEFIESLQDRDAEWDSLTQKQQAKALELWEKL